MLKGICLSNFVKFKEHHYLDFSDDSPFIFIGENDTGKSAVLEGVRRCLKPELSTNVSSVPDSTTLSYFICNFEKFEGGNLLSGIVAIPKEWENEISNLSDAGSSDDSDCPIGGLFQSQDSVDTIENATNQPGDGCSDKEKESSDNVAGTNELESETIDTSGNNSTADGNNEPNSVPLSVDCQDDQTNEMQDTTGNATTQQDTYFFKFVTKYSDQEEPLLFVAPRNDNTNMFDEWRQTGKIEDITEIIEIFTASEQKLMGSGESIQKCLTTIFNRQSIADNTQKSHKQPSICTQWLESLSDQVVFTFPLHSIGPLQWSKSTRFSRAERDNNYSQAEERCEVIRYFFLNEDEFDKHNEEIYFKAITKKENSYFIFENEKVSTPDKKYGKYGILKIPEGIYEAKIISVLLSSKLFKTIILEEPDKGMHPQFVDRMMQVIEQNKRDKRVILTTHNKALITPWSLQNCFVFKNIANSHDGKEVRFHIFPAQTILGAQIRQSVRMKKLRQLTSNHVSDIFFARKVLFFEGDSELLFFTELKQLILQGVLQDRPLFKSVNTQLKETFSELTLVKMNGKGMTNLCHEICASLELEHLIVVDRNLSGQNTKNDDIKSCNGEDERKKLTPDREAELKRATFVWNGDIEDMVLNMCKKNQGLLEYLEKQNVTLNPDTLGKRKETCEKLFLREKVTPENVKSSVKMIIEKCKNTDDLYQLIEVLGKDRLFIK